MGDLKRIKLFLLDMDGTIYLDETLFQGTKEFLAYVREIGGRYIFLTNNSSKSIDKYIEKLRRLGIDAGEEDFVTSTTATALYLRKQSYQKIYALGTRSFREQLSAAGLPVTDALEPDIDCLCMGFDTELTFRKLEDACILLNRGAAYVATNPDWVCPTWYGSVPDCGSLSQILRNATGRSPLFIGKPEPAMAELAMERTGFGRDETAVVGDRLYTDIACGRNAGAATIFVLSGEGTLADVEKEEHKPDFIFRDILELYRSLTGDTDTPLT